MRAQLDRSRNQNNQTVDQTDPDITMNQLHQITLIDLEFSRQVSSVEEDQNMNKMQNNPQFKQITSFLKTLLSQTQQKYQTRISQLEKRIRSMQAQIKILEEKLQKIENQTYLKIQQKKLEQNNVAKIEQQIKKIQNQFRVWLTGVLLFPEDYFINLNQAISLGMSQQNVYQTYQQIRNLTVLNKRKFQKKDIQGLLKDISLKQKKSSGQLINFQTLASSKLQNKPLLLQLIEKVIKTFEIKIQLGKQALEQIYRAMNIVIENIQNLKKYTGLQILSSIIIKYLFCLNRRDEIVQFHFKLQKISIMIKSIKQIAQYFEKKK